MSGISKAYVDFAVEAIWTNFRLYFKAPREIQANHQVIKETLESATRAMEEDNGCERAVQLFAKIHDASDFFENKTEAKKDLVMDCVQNCSDAIDFQELPRDFPFHREVVLFCLEQFHSSKRRGVDGCRRKN